MKQQKNCMINLWRNVRLGSDVINKQFTHYSHMSKANTNQRAIKKSHHIREDFHKQNRMSQTSHKEFIVSSLDRIKPPLSQTIV